MVTFEISKASHAKSKTTSNIGPGRSGIASSATVPRCTALSRAGVSVTVMQLDSQTLSGGAAGLAPASLAGNHRMNCLGVRVVVLGQEVSGFLLRRAVWQQAVASVPRVHLVSGVL